MTHRSVGPIAWITGKVLDWIARKSGKPTLDELKEGINDSFEYQNIQKKYSAEAWRNLHEKFPELRRLQELLVARKNSAEYRAVQARIVKWFRENEKRLPK